MKLKHLWILVLTLSIVGCFSNKPAQLTADEAADPIKASHLNIKMGMAYLNQGQVSRAKTKLIHAVELAPELPEAHSNLAYLWQTLGEDKAAEKSYKKAITLADNKGAFYNNYGAFLCHLGRYDDAEVALKAAIADKTYANTAEVYENAGLCALQSGQPKKAEQYFTRAIQHDPRRVKAMLELAELSFHQRRYEQAETLLNSYKHLANPTARSLWLKIRTSNELGDKDAVEDNAIQLSQMFRNTPEYQAYQAQFSESQG